MQQTPEKVIHRAYAGLLQWGVALLALSVGCSNDVVSSVAPPTPKPSRGPFASPFPIHQDDPAWSSLGLIAYHDYGVTCVDQSGAYSADTSLAGLWILDPQSGDRHRLLPYGTNPAWSPDGSQLAFDYRAQIFVIDRDGKNQRVITDSGRNFSPAWNANGSAITFDSNRSGYYDIWIANSDGSSQRELCASVVGDRRMSDWSPKGNLLVTWFGGGATSKIFEVDSMTCGSRQLTFGYTTEGSPHFSPDGTKVAFDSYSAADGSLQEVWVMNADGTGPRQVTRMGGASPTWSPSGTEIAYVRIDRSTNSPALGVIWEVNLTTGEERQVTWQWPCR